MAKNYNPEISGLLDESGELRTEFKYTPLKENIPWNPETFKKGYDGHSILEKANVEEYSNLMLGGGRIMSVSPNTPDQLTLETAFLRLLQYFHNELFPSQHFFPWHFPSYLPMSLKQIYHQLSRP